MQPLRINIDRVIFFLLCAFAFLIPFEHLLEVFFGVKTVLKPYRIMSILVILLYVVKVMNNGMNKINYEDDLPFYLIFAYGLIISCFRMVVTPRFSMRFFNNDTFQISLYLITYFIIKNLQLTKNQWIKIFWSLTAGITLNSYYLFSAFFFNGNYSRQGGFMNNPNYVALSIVIAVAFIIYRISVTEKGKMRQLFYIGLVLFLLFVFPVTGSRTGLAILSVIGIMLFVFASLRAKIGIFAGIIGLTFFFLSQNSDKFNVGAFFVLINRVNKKQGVEDVRIPIWRGALKAAEDVYFTGQGIGQFKAQFSRRFQNEYHKTILEVVNRGAQLSAHSDYVGILVVYGIVGLLLYLYFLFKIGLKLLRHIYFSKSDEEARFFQFNLMVLAAIVIFGLGSENFLSPIYWALLAFCTASLMIEFKTETSEKIVDKENSKLNSATIS